MKQMKEKSGTKITRKSSLVVGVLLLCLEHTHIKSLFSFYTREREKREILPLVLFFFLSSLSERERV